MTYRVEATRHVGFDLQSSASRRNRSLGVLQFHEQQEEIKGALGSTVLLRRAVEDLRQILGGAGGRRGPTRVLSTADIGLGQARSTTLISTAQVRTAATAYVAEDRFGGPSNSLPTITGTYDGAQGDDTLTFTVMTPGQRPVGGARPIRLRVTDGGGAIIDELTMPGGSRVDQSFALSNGLAVAFSSGALVARDSFSVAVSVADDRTVDPGRTLADVGFEGSLAVGSFVVEGATIAVDPVNDSVDDVLRRVSAAGVGVDAAFDTASQTVVLSRDTPSADDIVLGGDTSGFLAAVHLDGAVADRGSVGDEDAVIANVAALSGLSSGIARVDGIDIAVDIHRDTLQDVLDRIEDEAGVSAALVGDRITVRGGRTLTLEDGDTGLFTALNLPEGRQPLGRGSGLAVGATAEAVTAVFSHVGDLFHSPGGGPAQTASVQSLRDAVSTLIQDASGEDGPRIRIGFGITMNLDSDGGAVVDLDPNALRQGIGEDPDTLRVFFGDGDGEGLLDALADRLAEDEETLKASVGAVGILASVWG